ncbi:hypothetical protein HY629_02970 [Candidatus Uhrbacteria bacterium]|nr:hypothetical protein [Candidatus Uhrbacteria bacterium]
MQLTYTTQLLKEGTTYISYSPELDLSSCGDSSDAARRGLHEAVTLFIEEAQKMGTLERILEEAGFRKAHDRWEAPEFIGFERSAFAF